MEFSRFLMLVDFSKLRFDPFFIKDHGKCCFYQVEFKSIFSQVVCLNERKRMSLPLNKNYFNSTLNIKTS